MASSSRVPQGEVIIDFLDGGSYNKSNLENAVLDLERKRITQEEGKKAQSAMAALDVGQSKTQSVKSEDVDFIASQVSCSKSEAEAALKEEGDVVKALIRLVKPKPRASSVGA